MDTFVIVVVQLEPEGARAKVQVLLVEPSLITRVRLMTVASEQLMPLFPVVGYWYST